MNKKLFKSLSLVASASFCCLPIASCSKVIKLEKVEFNQQYSYVKAGSARDFSKEIKLTPENTTEKSLRWSISDPTNSSIAVVDEDTGIVTGLGTGMVNLTCTSTIDSTKSCTQSIVVGNYIELKEFSTDTAKTIIVGEKQKISRTYSPINATTAKYEHVKWETSDESKATVDQDGIITGVAAGTTTITATPYDYNSLTKTWDLKESLKKQCTVTVEAAIPKKMVIKPSAITVQYDASASTQQEFIIQPSVSPILAPQDYKYWYSTDLLEEVTSNTTGILKFRVKNGITTLPAVAEITCYPTGYESLQTTCSVTIVEKVKHVTDLYLQSGEGKMEISIGRPGLFPNVTVLPEDATNKDIVWTIDDAHKQYVSVDPSNNLVLPLKETPANDPAILKATSVDSPNVSVSVKVTVKEIQPESIDILYAPQYVGLDCTSEPIQWRINPTTCSQNIKMFNATPNIIDIDEQTHTIKGKSLGTGQVNIYSSVDPNIRTSITVRCIPYTPFVSDSWEHICEAANTNTLHQRYSLDCEQNIKFPGTLIGYEKQIVLNDNLTYKVRVIGENHDDLADGSGKKAALTLELTTVVCKSNKEEMDCQYDSDNREFANSTLCHNLNGGSHKTWSTPMIDFVKANGIGDNLKYVKKTCYYAERGKWTKKEFNTCLFPLTLTEFDTDDIKTEGSPYEYYSATGTQERRKADLKGQYHYYWTMSQSYNDYADYMLGVVLKSDGTRYLTRATEGNAASFAFCI